MTATTASPSHKAAEIDIAQLWRDYCDSVAAVEKCKAQHERDPSDASAQALDAAEQHASEWRKQVAEYYLPLLKSTAERVHRRLPSHVPLDDLMNAGVFGLYDAIAAFDPELGNKFETFSRRRLEGSMLDHLRSLDPSSRLIRQRQREVSRRHESFRKTYGRAPSQEELYDDLQQHNDETDPLIIMRDALVPKITSLSAPTNARDQSSGEAVELIKDERATDPQSVAQLKDLREFLTKHMSKRHRLILLLYHLEGMTMKEVGRTLDLSESRVSQEYSKINKILRARVAQWNHEGDRNSGNTVCAA